MTIQPLNLESLAFHRGDGTLYVLCFSDDGPDTGLVRDHQTDPGCGKRTTVRSRGNWP